jgi:hypothetical protein
MTAEHDHYPEPNEVASDNRTCVICEWGDNDSSRGRLIQVGQRPDNKKPIWCHDGPCLNWDTQNAGQSFDNLFRGKPQLTLTASREEPENIWAFASRFKYFTATSGTMPDNSTVQQTFPTISTPAVAPAVQTDASVDHTRDGTYEPPTTF